MKINRSIVSLGGVSLLLLAEVSILLPPKILPAYALGCSPNIIDFQSNGPYASSLEGFVDVGNRTAGDQMISVLTVEPGSVASFKVAYSLTFPSRWDFSLQPIILSKNTTVVEGLQPLLPPPAWLNASSEPDAIFVPPTGQVNATVTLQIDEAAQPGEYELVLAGWTGHQYDLKYCPYAPLDFILQVTAERPVTTTTNTTIITQIISRTTEFRTFTGKTVDIDPSLQVQTIQSILMTGNATQIAQRLASALNELPITLISEELPHGPDNTVSAFQATYNYSTSKGSSIIVDFLYRNDRLQFHQLRYDVKANADLPSGIAPDKPPINDTEVARIADQIMTGLGVPLAQIFLENSIPSYNPATDRVVAWVQGYKGVPMAGTLATTWPGNRITTESNIWLEFDPPTGDLTVVNILGAYWYLIPASFPLEVDPPTAISTAVNTVHSLLNVSQIDYTRARLVAINSHLYYVISVGSSFIEYSMYINPRTGEVGLPLITTTNTTTTFVSTRSITSYVTQTTTLISTTTATEQVTDPSIYAWAIGATAAAVVLALVLLLRRSRSRPAS